MLKVSGTRTSASCDTFLFAFTVSELRSEVCEIGAGESSSLPHPPSRRHLPGQPWLMWVISQHSKAPSTNLPLIVHTQWCLYRNPLPVCVCVCGRAESHSEERKWQRKKEKSAKWDTARTGFMGTKKMLCVFFDRFPPQEDTASILSILHPPPSPPPHQPVFCFILLLRLQRVCISQ